MLCSIQPIIKLGQILLRKNGYKAILTGQPNNINCTNRNRHIFGRTVQYYIKLMVDSSILFTVNNVQVSNLMLFQNKAQMKTNDKKPIFNSKFGKNIYKNDSIISRKYCTKSCTPICRHCYHEETENAINRQILAELNACYAYLSMASFFGRTEIALPGCYGFFMKMHHEEHEHALIFINYQLMRGGHVHLCPLTVPECQNWEDIRKALAVAVELEKLIKEKLRDLYIIAEKHQDLHVMDLVTTKFMDEQERSICEISRLFIRANKMGSSGIADYLFDKEVHRAFVKNAHKDKPKDKDNKSDLYI